MSTSQELSPSHAPAPSLSSSEAAENSSNVGRIGDTEGSADSPTPTGDFRTVRTLYACVAEHETELSFEPNQIISKGETQLVYVLLILKFKRFLNFFAVRPSLEPGWLEGYLDGKFGLVPENYVEFIT